MAAIILVVVLYLILGWLVLMVMHAFGIAEGIWGLPVILGWPVILLVAGISRIPASAEAWGKWLRDSSGSNDDWPMVVTLIAGISIFIGFVLTIADLIWG